MKRDTKTLLSGKLSSVANMQSSNGNDVPNQFIIRTDRATIFQSYNSIIAIVPNDRTKYKTILGQHFDYSRTTAKYLNQFIGHNI